MRTIGLIRALAFLALMAAAVAAPPGARAQEGEGIDRSVESVYSVEWGALSLLDTYLSPLRQHGTQIGLGGEWRKHFTHRPDRWTMENTAGLSAGRALNPAGNSYIYDAWLHYDWGAWWRHGFDNGLTLRAGASAGLEAGVIYLPRNSNNPASAKGELRLSLGAGADWMLRIGRMPVRVSDTARLPSLSVFFSPQYGETYYEIYLGNHSGLAHCGWWGNHFALDNLLAVDLGLGRTALRVGYRLQARTSWVCHLNTQVFTNSLVIGVIPGGIGSKRNRR